MSLLAFDFETHLIQPGLLAPPVVCGAFATTDAPPKVLPRADSIEVLQRALADPTAVFVGANVAYDWGCYLRYRPHDLQAVWDAYAGGRVWDVLIYATLRAIAEGRLGDKKLLRRDGSAIPTKRYSLEECVLESLGRKDAKGRDTYRLAYATLENTPIMQWPSEARLYPLDDAQNTLLVCLEQQRGPRHANLAEQCHAALAAHLGSLWGVRVDPARISVLDAHVAEAMQSCNSEAQKLGFVRLDGTKDTKAIQAAVTQAYKGNPPRTAKGSVSTSRDTLEDADSPALETLVERSRAEKLQVYAKSLKDQAHKPLNVSCNILLSTGRASYQGLIQLIPRKGGVRQCFVARPGTVWSSVDYAAIEMSTLAQVHLWALGRSSLAEAINVGLDPHWLFGANMTGADYRQTLKVARMKGTPEADIRQAAKAANFGFPGMMGPAKFVLAKKREGAKVCEWIHRDRQCGAESVREFQGRELDLPMCYRCLVEARSLRDSYLRQWPEMRPYWEWVEREMARHEGHIRQFVSKRVRKPSSAPAAANSYFQGLAADGAKAALVAMTKEMYLDPSSPLYGSRLMVFAHDETILEIPEERAHEAAHRQAEIMVSEMRRFVPDVRVTAEPALMRRWDKDAEAVYVDGRLQVWEPKMP